MTTKLTKYNIGERIRITAGGNQAANDGTGVVRDCTPSPKTVYWVTFIDHEGAKRGLWFYESELESLTGETNHD